MGVFFTNTGIASSVKTFKITSVASVIATAIVIITDRTSTAITADIVITTTLVIARFVGRRRALGDESARALLALILHQRWGVSLLIRMSCGNEVSHRRCKR